jgi:poly-gamma-glutamate capsule biosynthesis protein CapA/YwtB (metallophosphatase superfamily)
MVRVPTAGDLHGALRRRVALVAVATAMLAACSVAAPSQPADGDGPGPAHAAGGGRHDTADDRHLGPVTLAFAGDMHFQLHLAALLDHPKGALGRITRSLADADLTMVNLETSISHRGAPEAKELETPDDRYFFRTSPAALDVLAAAGVDVVTMANNHGADYGPLGLQDTLRAIRHSPVHVVGVGMNRRAAFTPYRASVRGTTLAFFGADASFREGSSSVWAAGPRSAGIAAAHAAPPRVLLHAVRTAASNTDVVVIYMHWGQELQGCPTAQQRAIAGALALAGADVVVGAHAHVLLGSGWVGDTYVDYGLANFLWYQNGHPKSGVLQLRIESGHVVRDRWVPARLGTYGRPHPLTGTARAAAIANWRALRACTGLAPRPSS